MLDDEFDFEIDDNEFAIEGGDAVRSMDTDYETSDWTYDEASDLYIDSTGKWAYDSVTGQTYDLATGNICDPATGEVISDTTATDDTGSEESTADSSTSDWTYDESTGLYTDSTGQWVYDPATEQTYDSTTGEVYNSDATEVTEDTSDETTEDSSETGSSTDDWIYDEASGLYVDSTGEWMYDPATDQTYDPSSGVVYDYTTESYTNPATGASSAYYDPATDSFEGTESSTTSGSANGGAKEATTGGTTTSSHSSINEYESDDESVADSYTAATTDWDEGEYSGGTAATYEYGDSAASSSTGDWTYDETTGLYIDSSGAWTYDPNTAMIYDTATGMTYYQYDPATNWIYSADGSFGINAADTGLVYLASTGYTYDTTTGTVYDSAGTSIATTGLVSDSAGQLLTYDPATGQTGPLSGGMAEESALISMNNGIDTSGTGLISPTIEPLPYTGFVDPEAYENYDPRNDPWVVSFMRDLETGTAADASSNPTYVPLTNEEIEQWVYMGTPGYRSGSYTGDPDSPGYDPVNTFYEEYDGGTDPHSDTDTSPSTSPLDISPSSSSSE